ncbi:MAG: hypothetical protein RIR62_2839 [Pseudomonadota bacterium]
MSKRWLVLAGALMALQTLSLLQVARLGQRMVQMEAGVEFWQYGQPQCSAPAGQGHGTAPRGGLAAFLPEGAV